MIKMELRAKNRWIKFFKIKFDTGKFLPKVA